MTTAIDLYERKTFGFADGYSALDRHDFLGTVKMTGPTLVEPGNGYDRGGVVRHSVRLPVGMSPKAAAQALRDTLGGGRCRHEYDCCGCASRSVFTRLIAPRRLSVMVRTTFNY